MRLTIQLRYESYPQRPVSAWFLPGQDVTQWIRELCRAELAELGTRLFVVRGATDNPTPGGLLVIPRPGHQAVAQVKGMACGLIDQGICLPVEARLSAPLRPEELAKLATTELLFFHPTLGVSAFSSKDRLRVSDLLICPQTRPYQWNSAQHGSAPIPMLEHITLCNEADQNLYGDAAREIGSEPLESMPPAPDEPDDHSTAHLRRKLQGWVSETLSEAAKHLEATPPLPLKDKLEHWAKKQQQTLEEERARLRHKELHRLLYLLQEDPEAGLKRAVPLAAFPHRGLTEPSIHLGERRIEFDLTRLGGQPAQFWEIPASLREQLRDQYRRRADAELRAGRFRRAAYIYAELLGDLAAAAGALREGRHFREASILYAEKLNLQLEAARCLAEGGHLREAIDIYQRLNRLMNVAELYQQLGEHQSAERALRTVVNQRLETADFLGAAKLLDERLNRPQEAIHVLAAGWPASTQAVRCLQTQIAIFARLGNHEATLRVITAIPAAARPVAPPVALLELLSHTARGYPDPRVRHAAGDVCRVITSEELAVREHPVDPTLATRMVEAVAKSVPEDALLARDANRYLARLRATPPPPSITAITGKVQDPLILTRNRSHLRLEQRREFRLPAAIEWMHLRTVGDAFIAAGWRGPRFALARGRWTGEFQILFWNLPGVTPAARQCFEVWETQLHHLELAVPFAAMLTPQSFAANDELGLPEWMVNPVSWLGESLLAIHRGNEVAWTLQTCAERVTLSSFDVATGRMGSSLDVTSIFGDNASIGTQSISLHPFGQGAVIGHNSTCWLATQETCIQIDLPSRVVRLQANNQAPTPRLLVCHESGAVISWAGEAACTEIDPPLKNPAGTFLDDHLLLLSPQGGGALLHVDQKTILTSEPVRFQPSAVFAIEPTNSANELAVIASDGHVAILKLQPDARP